MKLTTLDEDLRIHQKLEDEPNDVGGLSAQALKEKFDQAGLTIQRYLNEVHLPEEEQAGQEVLQAAKTYTDEKTAQLGRGDMATEVYDPQKRRTDIYAYAEAKANEAKADASKQEYIFAALCKTRVNSNGKGHIETEKLVMENAVDLKGTWDGETAKWTAPAGAKAMIVHLHMIWAREYKGTAYIRARVNGEDRLSFSGPFFGDGKYYPETLLIPLTVEGGDKVSICLEANEVDNNIAEIRMQEVYVEFIL